MSVTNNGSPNQPAWRSAMAMIWTGTQSAWLRGHRPPVTTTLGWIMKTQWLVGLDATR